MLKIDTIEKAYEHYCTDPTLTEDEQQELALYICETWPNKYLSSQVSRKKQELINSRKESVAVGLIPVYYADCDPFDYAEYSCMRDAVKYVLDTIPVLQKLVLYQYFWNEHSYTVIAVKYRCSIETVRRKYNRALHALRMYRRAHLLKPYLD